jgi:hypothetical protein
MFLGNVALCARPAHDSSGPRLPQCDLNGQWFTYSFDHPDAPWHRFKRLELLDRFEQFSLVTGETIQMQPMALSRCNRNNLTQTARIDYLFRNAEAISARGDR